jgi:hypothetical protein
MRFFVEYVMSQIQLLLFNLKLWGFGNCFLGLPQGVYTYVHICRVVDEHAACCQTWDVEKFGVKCSCGLKCGASGSNRLTFSTMRSGSMLPVILLSLLLLPVLGSAYQIGDSVPLARMGQFHGVCFLPVPCLFWVVRCRRILSSLFCFFCSKSSIGERRR